MIAKKIPIPGYAGAVEVESVRIVGMAEEDCAIIITYGAASTPSGGPVIDAEIAFTNILEYRWIHFGHGYKEFPAAPLGFCLAEIQDSPYVENMAARGPYRDWPGRFGLAIGEEEVRHYSLGFDEWGILTVICLGLEIRQLSGGDDGIPSQE